MPRSRNDKLSAMLITLCLITAAYAWFYAPETAPVSRTLDSATAPNEGVSESGTSVLDTATGSVRTVRGIEDYLEILDRPIFTLTRRPALLDIGDSAASAPSPTQPGDDPSPMQRATESAPLGLTLAGIMIVDKKRFALIRKTNDRTTQRLSAGDKIDGWQITALIAESITLTRGSRSTRLVLERKSNPLAAAAARAKMRADARRAKRKSPPTKPTRPGNMNDDQDVAKLIEQAMENEDDEEE